MFSLNLWLLVGWQLVLKHLMKTNKIFVISCFLVLHTYFNKLRQFTTVWCGSRSRFKSRLSTISNFSPPWFVRLPGVLALNHERNELVVDHCQIRVIWGVWVFSLNFDSSFSSHMLMAISCLCTLVGLRARNFTILRVQSRPVTEIGLSFVDHLQI